MLTQSTAQDTINNSRRIVIKIGTSSIIDVGEKRAKQDWLMSTAEQIVSLRQAWSLMGKPKDFVIVTSGAIGMESLQYNHQGIREVIRPQTPIERQTYASKGQINLMHLYSKCFSTQNVSIGQILLTDHNLQTPEELLLIKNNCDGLLKEGSIPAINANDAVSNSETPKDNDTLAAQVAVAIGADLLINVTDVDGFFDSDPRKNRDAKRMPEIDLLDRKLLSRAGGSRGKHSIGGMETKADAALIATEEGCSVFIVNGERALYLTRLFNGYFDHATFIPHTAHPQLRMF